MPRLRAVERECATITSRFAVSKSTARHDRRVRQRRSMALELDGFAAEAIDEEADRLGVSVEELVSFSVLYYLADVDSGRISREIAMSPYREDNLRPR